MIIDKEVLFKYRLHFADGTHKDEWFRDTIAVADDVKEWNLTFGDRNDGLRIVDFEPLPGQTKEVSP